MSEIIDEKYLFVIDTDSYAGNFEREMCAYITGEIGDCGVGSKYANLYKQEEKYVFATVISVPDENGCSRPCKIWQDSKGRYNSFAIFFYCKPTKEEAELMKKRAALFSSAKQKIEDSIYNRYKDFSSEIKILGFRLLQQKAVVKGVDL